MWTLLHARPGANTRADGGRGDSSRARAVCLCPTRGTRRSRRTERNSSETGGSETRGRTSRRKTRCDSLELRASDIAALSGWEARLGLRCFPSEVKARGQANRCGQRKPRREQRLGEPDPRAPRGAAARTRAGGQTPSQREAVLVQRLSTCNRQAGRLPSSKAPRCPADGVADQPRNHRSLASEARAASRGPSCADGPQPERLDARSPRGEGGHPNFHFSRPLPIHSCVLSACRALERSPCLSHLHEAVGTQRTQTHTEAFTAAGRVLEPTANGDRPRQSQTRGFYHRDEGHSLANSPHPPTPTQVLTFLLI